MYYLNRLSSKEMYNFFVSLKGEKASSRLYYLSNLDWKNIYLLVRIVTKDSKLRTSQSKLLNNVL